MRDEALKQQIRQARGKFVAMAGTYSLGVFNDQFYKQAAMLLAVAIGLKHLQGRVLLVFTLPYLLFAAYAGWLADRFPKNRVVIAAKVMELAAMTCGGIGIALQSWPLVLVMACIMGWQSCIFSPSLNGSIPELYPASYVTTANGFLKVFVTASILTGVAAAGPVLDIPGTGPRGIPMGRLAAGIGVIAVSTLGVVISFFVPRRPAADPRARFPWTGFLFLNTVRELGQIRKDRLLWTTVCADVFVWFVGSVQVLLINVMGVEQFGYSKTLTSAMLASEVLGLAIGGLLGARLARGERWYRVLAPSALLMSALLAGMTLTPAVPASVRPAVLMALLGGAGLAGGILMIPCEAFIQVRPVAERRGTVIASANFAIFLGILLSAPITNTLNALVTPTVSFGLLGALSLLAADQLAEVLPRKGHVS